MKQITNEYEKPLPNDKLLLRYKSLFDAVKKGQESIFVGLPESAKSGYIQFLLRNTELSAELFDIDFQKNKIIYFEPVELAENEEDSWIIELALRINAVYGEKVINCDGSILEVFYGIKSFVEAEIRRGIKITILFARPGFWESRGSRTSSLLFSLWDSSRSNVENGLTYIFFHYSKTFNIDSMPQFWQKLNIPLYRNIFYFKTLDEEELEYTVKRIYFNKKVQYPFTDTFKLFKLTGGYYPVLTSLTDILIHTPSLIDNLDNIYNDSLIQSRYKHLFSTFTDQQIHNLYEREENYSLKKLGFVDEKYELVGEWAKLYLRSFKAPKREFIVEPDYLSIEEGLVFRHFMDNFNKTISKEEIANVIWKDKAIEKYSEWAIDKIISRMRAKLKQHNSVYEIVTVRELGYYLLSR